MGLLNYFVKSALAVLNCLFLIYLYLNVQFAPTIIPLIILVYAVQNHLLLSQLSHATGTTLEMMNDDKPTKSGIGVALLSTISMVLIAIAGFIFTVYLIFKLYLVSPNMAGIYIVLYILGLISTILNKK